ncbi:MAG: glycosyltransferase family 2 protein [Gammaproteobacteria bacterium]
MEDKQKTVMDVTIIIVSWNSEKLIGKCLEAISKQTIQPDDIIVIDNNSSDQSASIAEKFDNVVVRRMSTNLGFAGGNNRVLSECSTKWVALLNPDAFPEENWLEALQTASIDNPDVIAFGSRQLSYEDPSIVDGLGDAYHISGAVWRDQYGKKQNPSDMRSKEIFSPCAAAALYDLEAVIQAGMFDEDYFCYLEDMDLGFRLRLLGHKIIFVPDAIVHHVGSASTGGRRSDFSVYHGHRNIVWTFFKNVPGCLFWMLLPLHLLMNITAIVSYVLRGRSEVILQSKYDALKGIPDIWAKRKTIQKNQIATKSDIWKIMSKMLPGTR